MVEDYNIDTDSFTTLARKIEPNGLSAIEVGALTKRIMSISSCSRNLLPVVSLLHVESNIKCDEEKYKTERQKLSYSAYQCLKAYVHYQLNETSKADALLKTTAQEMGYDSLDTLKEIYQEMLVTFRAMLAQEEINKNSDEPDNNKSPPEKQR